MGFDVERFTNDVDEECICSICSSVMDTPLQTPCEHAFCRECIHTWLKKKSTCPVDRQKVKTTDLIPACRLLRNLLSRLELRCVHTPHGCTFICKIEVLCTHESECSHNPMSAVQCEQGCELHVLRKDLSDHDCLRELRNIVTSQAKQIVKLREEIQNAKRRRRLVSSGVNSEDYSEAADDDADEWPATQDTDDDDDDDWESMPDLISPSPPPPRYNPVVHLPTCNCICEERATNLVNPLNPPLQQLNQQLNNRLSQLESEVAAVNTQVTSAAAAVAEGVSGVPTSMSMPTINGGIVTIRRNENGTITLSRASQATDTPAATVTQTTPLRAQVHTGKCKWFRGDRGYGFITPSDGGEDVFVHQSAILASGYRVLQEGQQVEYKLTVDEAGRRRCSEVTGPNGDDFNYCPTESYDYSSYGEAGGGW